MAALIGLRDCSCLPPALSVSRRSHVYCLAVSGPVNVCRREWVGAWQVPTPISPAGRLAALAPLAAVGDGRQGRDWLRGRDLNPRPSGYEPDELPGCSTPTPESKAPASLGSGRVQN